MNIMNIKLLTSKEKIHRLEILNTIQKVRSQEDFSEKALKPNKSSDSKDLITFNWPNKPELESFPPRISGRMTSNEARIKYDFNNSSEVTQFMKRYPNIFMGNKIL